MSGGSDSERLTAMQRAMLAWQGHVWGPLRQTISEAYRKQYYPLGYSPALDGLRGLMTIGIIVAHTRYALVPGALLFMDMFFVMSGYFITSLLLRDIERHGRIRYWPFYRRRFARLVHVTCSRPAASVLPVPSSTNGWKSSGPSRASSVHAARPASPSRRRTSASSGSEGSSSYFAVAVWKSRARE